MAWEACHSEALHKHFYAPIFRAQEPVDIATRQPSRMSMLPIGTQGFDSCPLRSLIADDTFPLSTPTRC